MAARRTWLRLEIAAQRTLLRLETAALRTLLSVKTAVQQTVGRQYARTLDVAWSIGGAYGGIGGVALGGITGAMYPSPSPSLALDIVRIVGATVVGSAGGGRSGWCSALSVPPRGLSPCPSVHLFCGGRVHSGRIDNVGDGGATR